MENVTATSKRQSRQSDKITYRVTEVFSPDRNMGDIMKRVLLKKAREFQNSETPQK